MNKKVIPYRQHLRSFKLKGNLLDILQNSLTNPQNKIYQAVTFLKSEYSTQNPSFPAYAEQLASIGKQCNFINPIIYNPCGGFDSLTGFLLNPSCTDLISVGLENFGSHQQISALAKTIFLEDNTVFSNVHPLFPRFLDYDKKDLYLKFPSGLGLISMIRIIFYLNGQVNNINYFDLTDNTSTDQNSSTNFSNAVIEFSDTNKNKKRFWYIKQNLWQNNNAFSSFIENIPASDLLLKATMGIFTPENPEIKKNLNTNILKNTIQFNTSIISDLNRSLGNFQEIAIPFFFGYSNNNIILHGKGENISY